MKNQLQKNIYTPNVAISFMAMSVFKVELFFSVAAFLGYTYLGSDSSKIYVVLMAGIGVLSIGIGIFAIFNSNRIKSIESFLLFVLPLIVFSSFIVSRAKSASVIAIQQNQFNLFLAFSLPALFCGWFLAKNKIDLFLSVLFVMLLISAGSIVSILIPFLSGKRFTVMGGASYQAASYYTAFAFGLNLYIILFKASHINRNKIRKRNVLIQILLISLLILQSIMVIIPGGRGAFILMVIYLSLSIMKCLITRNVIRVMYAVFIIVVLLVILGKVFQRLLENSLFLQSFNRVLAFIGQGGTVNWDGSSERLPIYQEAINLFLESPIIGYGLYGYISKVSYAVYPHNFFLEVLLQGGLIYLSVWIVFIWYILKKMYFLVLYDKRKRLFLYIGLYPAVMLMFSGSYLSNGLFWFLISLISAQ
jgi:O-antigen ligase